MNRALMACAVLIMLAIGLSACGDRTPSEKARAAGDAVGDAMQVTGNAVGDAARTAGDAVGDAMQTTGEFLTQSKDADVKAAQEEFDRIEKEWRSLLASYAPTTDAAQIDFQNAKDQMAGTLADARAKLAEAKDASPDSWQKDIKPALDAVLQEAQRLYENAFAMFGGN